MFGLNLRVWFGPALHEKFLETIFVTLFFALHKQNLVGFEEATNVASFRWMGVHNGAAK